MGVKEDFERAKVYLRTEVLAEPKPKGMAMQRKLAQHTWRYLGCPGDEFGQCPDYIYEAVDEIIYEVYGLSWSDDLTRYVEEVIE